MAITDRRQDDLEETFFFENKMLWWLLMEDETFRLRLQVMVMSDDGNKKTFW